MNFCSVLLTVFVYHILIDMKNKSKHKYKQTNDKNNESYE